MKTLITGHRGFIGSLLNSRIEASGVDVRDGLNILTCDLPDADIVYHLAAQSSVEGSWNDPVHDMANIQMVARLVKRYPNAKIIYASSAAAQDPVASPYGFSKKMAGEYLKIFHPNSVLCVFANVYGNKDGKSVVDIFKRSNEVVIYGDGDQERDFVHVDDIVNGLLLARDWEPGTYFMGTGKPTTVNELAKHKKKTYAPARKEARRSILKNSTPDWYPTIDVMEYLYES